MDYIDSKRKTQINEIFSHVSIPIMIIIRDILFTSLLFALLNNNGV